MNGNELWGTNNKTHKQWLGQFQSLGTIKMIVQLLMIKSCNCENIICYLMVYEIWKQRFLKPAK